MDLILLFFIIFSTVFCIKNFGKGIKEILIKQTASKDVGASQLAELA
jgi:hypothetical protein